MAGLLDVNVLIALLHERHQNSVDAVRWLQRQTPRSVLVCRVAQMGALRILTNAGIMKEDVVTATEFWDGWERLIGDERFSFAGEPVDFEDVWRETTRTLPKGESAGTDTYFAAFARAGGWSLISFDQGLSRFAGLRTELPA
jgi:toxin-antitoxin system PIN domain toxin